ncbi:hypothetical protein F5X68DRAFT_229668 [Plectosphaerella plurivora]|uniref:Uncharacterized protein n=1 Tax=Plectosphaerella plurivora TaxID=936078 RepID=A0A9P8VFT1_9PEZI|nr:hypothetical protein F5X68DRAFT_229668 [Plectosphaerella plurivora]
MSLTKQISAFLLQMSEQWQTFVQSLPVRGYPIFVWELESLFRLKSPTLQGILFTVCRRTMGIMDGDAARNMQDLFNEDRRATAAGLSGGQRQEMQSKLLMSYSQIVSAYRSAMAQQGQQANTPPLPQSQWQQQQQQQFHRHNLQQQQQPPQFHPPTQQQQQPQNSAHLQQQREQEHRQNVQLQQMQQYQQQQMQQQMRQQQQQWQQMQQQAPQVQGPLQSPHLQQAPQAQGQLQSPQLQQQGFRPTSSQSARNAQQSRPGSSSHGAQMQQGPSQTPSLQRHHSTSQDKRQTLHNQALRPILRTRNLS